jgi:hypothetical protein
MCAFRSVLISGRVVPKGDTLMKRRAFAGAALGLASGLVLPGRAPAAGSRAAAGTSVADGVGNVGGTGMAGGTGPGATASGALHVADATAPAAAPVNGGAPARRPLTLGMVLEPPALDPTAGAAAAIAEVVLYNVFETLVHVGPHGKISPLLAERWHASDDQKVWTFILRPDVRFQNGKPCDAQAVKASFERAGAKDSVNKDRPFFAAMTAIEARDARTVVIRLSSPDADFLFQLGQATAVIVEPGTVATNAAQPVGTGPYRLGNWRRGASLQLVAWEGFREPAAIQFSPVTFRFIGEPAAQMAALMAGEVDVFPRVTERAEARFRGNTQWRVQVSSSRAKTLVAINHRRKALADVRVRRAIAAAIDRQAVLKAGQLGHGTPIGSHYTPDAPGYVDLTTVNPYDPARAKALLKEAGVPLPLSLVMTVPPTPYARQGAQVVMAQLAKVGIVVRLQQVEWAQWLQGTYRNHDYDLSIVSHVEPLDLGNFARPDYYWGYRSPKFDALYRQLVSTVKEDERLKRLAEVQRLLADDCVLAWLYQPHWVSVSRASITGLWDDMPMLANDLRALHWEG